jgi:hypothetical protein
MVILETKIYEWSNLFVTAVELISKHLPHSFISVPKFVWCSCFWTWLSAFFSTWWFE